MLEKIQKLEAENHKLISTNIGLRKMLARHEWDAGTGSWYRYCCYCHGNKDSGHEEDCEWNLFFYNKEDPSFRIFESLVRTQKYTDSLILLLWRIDEELDELVTQTNNEKFKDMRKRIKKRLDIIFSYLGDKDNYEME